jgi:hypothetical protein
MRIFGMRGYSYRFSAHYRRRLKLKLRAGSVLPLQSRRQSAGILPNVFSFRQSDWVRSRYRADRATGAIPGELRSIRKLILPSSGLDSFLEIAIGYRCVPFGRRWRLLNGD